MRCKAGDLAFILSGPLTFPQNVGKIVKVVRPSILPNRDWHVRSEGAELIGVKGAGMEGEILDATLSPIRPEPELLPAPPVAVTV